MAVVGGGFSGVMTAVQLACRGVPVRLFEPGAEPGRGLAYGTRDPVHLLNVPAAKMSAWPNEPDHFRAWLGSEPGTFACRRDYGRYVGGILAAHPEVEVERASVTEMERHGEGWSLRLADGRSIAVSAAVLALGNEPPAVRDEWRALPVIANPWSEEAHEALTEVAARAGDLLLIGTGLTMIDVMLTLQAKGFAGRAVAVSRRGLLPRAHQAHEAAPVALAELPLASLTALWRWLRRRSGIVGFRAAIDSLRPHSAALWVALPVSDRRRFLRHARPWWDVHRHRIAPQVAERLQAMIAGGQLEVIAGRVLAGEDGGVRLQLRGGGERQLSPSLVVNCTGPLGDIRQTSNRLLAGLLAAGLVRADPLGLGLEVDKEDRAAPRLWALGPLTKGMYWEITAVPDIRLQAERVAAAITKELIGNG